MGCSREKGKSWCNQEAFLCSSPDIAKEILEERVETEGGMKEGRKEGWKEGKRKGEGGREKNQS